MRRLLVAVIVIGAAVVHTGFRAMATSHSAKASLARLSAAGATAAVERLADYPIRPVPLTAVTITDGFWRPKIEINRTVTIPHVLHENEITGRVDNFLKAARALARTSSPEPRTSYKGHRYDDTDIYKIIEAASYSLAAKPDLTLDRKLDELIAIVAAAQEPDGYLYAARTVDPEHPAPGAGPGRWLWLHTSHELYNQGHLYEAAVAHVQATGKRTLLNVAIKSADLVCRTFGPNGRRDVPGHEEIELALVKLSRATGDRRYLDEARFFLAQRGQPHNPPLHEFAVGDPFRMYNDLAYRQDAAPVTEQTRAVGHAVRAVYLYSGLTDAATLLDVGAFARTVKTLWQDVVSKRTYLTGGLGSVGGTEAFGDDHVLPNRAYAETCASVGGMLWYHRMFLREGQAAYYDAFERTLYNGYLSGVSLAGNTFFYQNPLVSNGKLERSAYFDVACCPANLARLMAQLPGLIYAQREEKTAVGVVSATLFVNLFVGSEATVMAGSTRVHLTQQTTYPWDGHVTIRINPDKPTTLALAIRIPGWARGAVVPSDLYRFAAERAPAPTLRVNGQAVALTIDRGFATIRREWKASDTVVLELPMKARRVLANDAVDEDRGKAAIERGPIVYALEGIDNGGQVSDVRIPLDAPLVSRYESSLLGGVVSVTGTATAADGSRRTVTAVPYYAWNNRGKGEMEVWIPY